ncbi:ribonuclease H-like domain-containing protein [Tanacetum coccineum]
MTPLSVHMDTGDSSHLNNSVYSLSTILNLCMHSSVSVGDGHSIPVTNTGHSILPTPSRTLHLNNVLITPHIVKKLIYVRQFVRDNDCTIEFDSFGFSVKDFMTRWVLLRCDSTGDLYPVTSPSPIPHAFLVSQHTWHQRLGHPGSKVLRSLVSNNIIYVIKKSLQYFSMLVSLYLADGTLSRYKAWLVDNGSTQLEGVDVDETFSPVVKHGTIRMVLRMVYMHQPPGFRDFSYPDYVCLLQRSLYGLKQAPRAWFWRFASYITRVGFHHGRCDTSLFIYRHGMDTAYLLLYVDDIVITSSSSDLLQQIIRSLHQEFAMTDLGLLNYFLGISVTRDSSGMFLFQKKYDVEILEWAGMHQRTKHIEIDIYFVRDLVAANQVRVLHVPSRYQFADIFTKGLPSALFEEFRSSLSVLVLL